MEGVKFFSIALFLSQALLLTVEAANNATCIDGKISTITKINGSSQTGSAPFRISAIDSSAIQSKLLTIGTEVEFKLYKTGTLKINDFAIYALSTMNTRKKIGKFVGFDDTVAQSLNCTKYKYNDVIVAKNATTEKDEVRFKYVIPGNTNYFRLHVYFKFSVIFNDTYFWSEVSESSFNILVSPTYPQTEEQIKDSKCQNYPIYNTTGMAQSIPSPLSFELLKTMGTTNLEPGTVLELKLKKNTAVEMNYFVITAYMNGKRAGKFVDFNETITQSLDCSNIKNSAIEAKNATAPKDEVKFKYIIPENPNTYSSKIFLYYALVSSSTKFWVNKRSIMDIEVKAKPTKEQINLATCKNEPIYTSYTLIGSPSSESAPVLMSNVKSVPLKNVTSGSKIELKLVKISGMSINGFVVSAVSNDKNVGKFVDFNDTITQSLTCSNMIDSAIEAKNPTTPKEEVTFTYVVPENPNLSTMAINLYYSIIYNNTIYWLKQKGFSITVKPKYTKEEIKNATCKNLPVYSINWLTGSSSTESAPFNISNVNPNVDLKNVTSGSKIELKLGKTSGVKVTGFVVSAYSNGKNIGKFVDFNDTITQSLNCSNMIDSVIEAKNATTPKDEVKFKYLVPENPKPSAMTITFYYSIINSITNYWLKQYAFSMTVQPKYTKEEVNKATCKNQPVYATYWLIGSPSNESAPFNISNVNTNVDLKKVIIGSKIELKLFKTSGVSISGFVVSAYSNGKNVGKFMDFDDAVTQSVNCGNLIDSAIEAKNPTTPKEEVKFKYVVPEIPINSTITFYYSIINNNTYYWVKQYAFNMTVIPKPTTTTAVPTTTTKDSGQESTLKRFTLLIPFSFLVLFFINKP